MYVCRLCLNKFDVGFSLFTGNIVEKIESLTSIKITMGDNLPQTCCKSCMASVNTSYKFQQTVIESNNTLQTMSTDFKFEIKEESSDKDSLGEEQETKSNSSRASSSLEISDLVMLDYANDEDTVYKIVYDSPPEQTVEELYEVLSNDNDLECLQCGVKLSSKRLLQQHMAKHRVETCPFCNVVMRRDNLNKHIQIHTDSPEICEICGKIAKNKESLRGHMNYSHKKKEMIKCESCNKEFRSTNHFNTHIRNVHLGIRDHQCDICGKKFFTNYDLKKHIMMTHQKARPYKCPYCGKGFSSPYARKTHIRQHTLETPYHCDLCSAGFRQKVSLVTHIKSKHKDEIKQEVD